jgi:cyclic pyranopterin phosphate synthase
MNDVDFAVRDVLHGIEVAQPSGWRRSRSTWWSSAAPTTARSCRWRATSGSGIIVRFIEFMDVGASNTGRWTKSCRPPNRAPDRRGFPLEALTANYSGETAERWRYAMAAARSA